MDMFADILLRIEGLTKYVGGSIMLHFVQKLEINYSCCDLHAC